MRSDEELGLGVEPTPEEGREDADEQLVTTATANTRTAERMVMGRITSPASSVVMGPAPGGQAQMPAPTAQVEGLLMSHRSMSR